jgi:hypothetical protein
MPDIDVKVNAVWADDEAARQEVTALTLPSTPGNRYTPVVSARASLAYQSLIEAAYGLGLAVSISDCWQS